MRPGVRLAASLCAATAVAAPPSHGATWQLGRVSVGLAAGAMIPADTGQTVSGTALGLPVAAAGTMRYDPGLALDAQVAYRLNDWISAELALGWARYRYRDIRGTLTAGPITLHGGRVDGDVRYWTGFANVIVAPWGRARLSPYLGGGVGLADYAADLKSVTTATLGTVALNSRTGGRDLAVNGIAGVAYAVTESVSVGVRYRYLWTNSARTVTSGALTGRSADAAHHTLSLSVAYRL